MTPGTDDRGGDFGAPNLSGDVGREEESALLLQAKTIHIFSLIKSSINSFFTLIEGS